jgi:hypothetical protein
MILIELLRENKFMMSNKGSSALYRAIVEVYPYLKDYLDEKTLVSHVLEIDLPDQDVLLILQLAAKYSRLWAFA